MAGKVILAPAGTGPVRDAQHVVCEFGIQISLRLLALTLALGSRPQRYRGRNDGGDAAARSEEQAHVQVYRAQADGGHEIERPSHDEGEDGPQIEVLQMTDVF